MTAHTGTSATIATLTRTAGISTGIEGTYLTATAVATDTTEHTGTTVPA